MTSALVAINEGVALNQREPESRGFLNRAGEEVNPAESHARLGNRRFQRAQVKNTDQATGLLHDADIYFQHFIDGKIAHLSKLLVECGVLLKHVL